MKDSLYKRCERCRGTGKLKIRETKLKTIDVKRMISIMDKYDLKQLDLAKILEISQGTVNGWFYKKSNLQGKIKSIYFTMLKTKGYRE
jgi:DNA-binding transcriptional regulator YiaG